MGNANNTPCVGKCLGREGPDFHVPFESSANFSFDYFFNKHVKILEQKGVKNLPVASSKGLPIPDYDYTYPLHRTKSPQKILCAGRVLMDIHVKDFVQIEDYLRHAIEFVLEMAQTMVALMRAGMFRLSDPGVDCFRKILARSAAATSRYTKGSGVVAKVARRIRQRWRDLVVRTVSEPVQDLRALQILTGNISGLEKLTKWNSSSKSKQEILDDTDKWFEKNDLVIYVTESYLEKETMSPHPLHAALLARNMGAHGTDIKTDHIMSVGLKRELRRGTMLGAVWDALHGAKHSREPNCLSDNPSGAGPVWHAELLWRRKAVRLLVSNGSDLKAKDHWDRGPLHLAAAMGDVELVDLLLAQGCSKGDADKLGRTPKEWAKVYNHNDCWLRLNNDDTQPKPLEEIKSIPIFEQQELTFDQFINDFVQWQRPVLWRRGGEIAGMPAVLRWSTDYICQQVCGFARVNVAPIPFAELYNMPTRNATVKEYFSNHLEHEKFEYDPDFGADIDLAKARDICADLKFEDGVKVPEYLFAAELHRVCPKIVEDTSFLPEKEMTYIRAPQLAIGPAGSGATMHIHMSAVNTCVRGVRRWFLQAPPKSQWSQQFALEYAREFDQTPERDRDASILEVIQRPGDLLFVPEYWAHGTVNLTPCVAVGQEFIQAGSIFT
eukprot:gene658-962_t